MKYSVTVKPGSSKNLVSEVNPSEIVVYTTKHPHGGEANKAVIDALAKHFKIPKTSIKIERGLTSRHKIIVI